jgi:hypothetical protein
MLTGAFYVRVFSMNAGRRDEGWRLAIKNETLRLPG